MTSGTGRSLQVEVLGAGPAYTDQIGATGAAYLVRHGPTSLLLDLGQGSFPRLAGALEPSSLDAVVVSHLHPDHFIDLVALRHYLYWQFQPARRVRVLAPAGLAGRLDALHADPGFTAASLDVEDVRPGIRTVGTLTLEARRVTHTRDSHGFRVAAADGEGPGLVYSGDCGRAEDLDALVRPGDTLLSEVSFGPGPAPPDAIHLDGPAVAELATRTGAGAVVLTHLQMGFDRAATIESVRSTFPGPVSLVVPGDRFSVGDQGA
jgi:ribonuclease BN (tRNA processing enzyme)